MRALLRLLAIASVLVAAGAAEEARAGSAAPGMVANIKVLSDKVDDVSSIEAWKSWVIKPGMTDVQKALAVWESIVKFRYQETPPNEFLSVEENVHDPIKTFNVYGYGMCCCASSNVACLAREVGLKVRGLGISHHSVPEAFWDGGWHLLDTSLVTYFVMPDGHIASIDELIKIRADYMKDHPDFAPKWAFPLKKDWPAPFNTCPTVDDRGIFPARTHGLYSMWSCVDGQNNFVYEYGYSRGYRLNIRLRTGEKLIRNWSNKGLHVNMDGNGGVPGCLKMKVGEEFLVYTPKYGDLANGRIGNGEQIWDVPLKNGAYRASAESVDNVKDSAKGVSVAVGPKPGVIDLRIPSCYVYLGGELKGAVTVTGAGAVKVLMSRNNGVDWKEIGLADKTGELAVDLKPLVYRLYDYRLKFELTGGATLESLAIRHDIQHSQRALPAFAAGENTVTFTADSPKENTITIEAAPIVQPKGNQLSYTEFHPVVEKCAADKFKLDGGQGSVTFPIETPSDMKRIRFGCYYGVWGNAYWDLMVSFDEGKTWKQAGRCEKNPAGGWGMCNYVEVSDVPKGARKALVRYAADTKGGSLIIGGLRIDADYDEPNGGLRPVKITYEWEENGQPKQAVFTAKKSGESWKVTCAAKPVMKSITLELAE